MSSVQTSHCMRSSSLSNGNFPTHWEKTSWLLSWAHCTSKTICIWWSESYSMAHDGTSSFHRPKFWLLVEHGLRCHNVMGPPESYSMWNERSQTVPQFKFWSMIIELELLMTRCVRPCEKETSHYMYNHATNSAASSAPWTIRSSLHNKILRCMQNSWREIADHGPYSWVGHKVLWPVITPMIEHTATTSYSWARKALSYITVTVTTLGPNTPRYNAGPSCATSQSHQWLPNTSCYYS